MLTSAIKSDKITFEKLDNGACVVTVSGVNLHNQPFYSQQTLNPLIYSVLVNKGLMLNQTEEESAYNKLKAEVEESRKVSELACAELDEQFSYKLDHSKDMTREPRYRKVKALEYFVNQAALLKREEG